jgi:hypothetical protein
MNLSPELLNAVAVVIAIVVVYLFALLFAEVRKTEVYKQLQIKLGVLPEIILDAIFQVEFAKPEVLAAYEEKSQITGYNKKLLLAGDLVEQALLLHGITIDLETQVYPRIERLLQSNATPDSYTPKTSADPTALRAQAARIEKARK